MISTDDFERVKLQAEFLRALASANRLKILLLLNRREMTVGELVNALNLSYPLVSQHLATLYRANAITRRREWNRVYHAAASSETEAVLFTLFGETFYADAIVGGRANR